MAVGSEYEDLLNAGPVKGDPDAEAMSKWDLGGDFLFGYGDASRNKAIRKRQAKITAMQGQLSAEQRRRLEESLTANTADWDALTTQILGSDGNKLKDFYKGVEGQEAGALDDLKGTFGQYQGQEDLFNDPNFYGDVGDVSNQAKPSDATVQEQRGYLAKMKSLSDPTESAQERFQRLMAQNEAEANMKGARDSIASDLKARGVYGSGAEVVQNMMAQADAGNRRYMANLAANAQAQQRATQMMGMGSQLAGQMRGAETSEGQLANQVAQFNNQTNQNLMNTRSGALQSGRGVDNAERNKMGTTTYEATTGLTGRQRGDLQSQIGTTTGLAKGKIGIRDTGTGMRNAADQARIDAGEKAKGGLESQIEDDAILGGGMG